MDSQKLLARTRAWRDGEAAHGPLRGMQLYATVVQYIHEQEQAARLDERQQIALADQELGELIVDLISRVIRETAQTHDKPDAESHRQLIQLNATKCLLSSVWTVLGERERQARLDEHRILAGLDEEGRKQRYLELAQEVKRS